MAMVIADVPEVHGPVIILLERTRSAPPCSKPTTTPCAGSPSGPARRPAYRAHRRAARDSVTASRATSFSRRIGTVRNLEMSLSWGKPHTPRSYSPDVRAGRGRVARRSRCGRFRARSRSCRRNSHNVDRAPAGCIVSPHVSATARHPDAPAAGRAPPGDPSRP
jgi:hypothetical protein